MGRSMCPHCRQDLLWFELIPIISFLVQKGKCRSCIHPISSLYPIIELISGVLFVFALWQVGFQSELIMALLLISISMIVMVTDLYYMIIPNRVLLFFLPCFIFAGILTPLEPWHDALTGAVCGFLLIGSVIVLSGGGMGAGDMKLLALLGSVLGLKKIILTFFLAVCLGGIIGIGMIIAKRANRKEPVPFAPYLLTGALVSFFYGNRILQIYGIIIGA